MGARISLTLSCRHREVRADALGLEVTVEAPASLSGSTEKGLVSFLCSSVILKARAAGLIPSVKPVLDRADAFRFHLDPQTRTAVLRLVGETG